MKDFLKDIFLYHYNTNKQIFQSIETSRDKQSPELLDILSHSVNAHQIWNARIMGRKTLDAFQRHELHHCQAWDKHNYFDTVDIIESKDLQEIVDYKNALGESYSNSIRDILFHISNHFSHHRGQLVRVMRKSGIEPPLTDYIFYKRKDGFTK